jgi:hypothetical protein
MLDHIKMLAFGQTKQDCSLQEARSNRLIKATRDSRQTLHTRLIQRIGQWLPLLGQRMHVVGHLASDEISAREEYLIPTGDPSRVEQADQLRASGGSNHFVYLPRR